MRLSPKAMAIGFGLLWGGGILVVGLANLAYPSYGTVYLQAVSSIYPGFHNAHNVVDVLVGTGYGIVDGGAGGFVLTWIYNFFAKE